MRNVSAIFFLTVILLSQTPLQQVLKLPVLVEHYKEHQVGNTHISFAAFIVLHYFSGNPKDSDYDRDLQLPFRSNAVILMGSTVILPGLINADFAPPVYQEKSYSLFHLTQLSSSHTSGIWQPPKVC